MTPIYRPKPKGHRNYLFAGIIIQTDLWLRSSTLLLIQLLLPQTTVHISKISKSGRLWYLTFLYIVSAQQILNSETHLDHHPLPTFDSSDNQNTFHPNYINEDADPISTNLFQSDENNIHQNHFKTLFDLLNTNRILNENLNKKTVKKKSVEERLDSNEKRSALRYVVSRRSHKIKEMEKNFDPSISVGELFTRKSF